MSKINAIVREVTALTERISEFRIAAADGAALPGWDAGAHVLFDLPDGDTRAYSLIAFAPMDKAPEEYRIAVQREPEGKGGSTHMHGLKPGAEITCAAPKNDFPLTPNAPAVLLAGGIGITPMISMATTLKDAGQAFEFHYSGRSAGVMAYREALQETFGDSLHLHCDDAASALDLDAVIAGLAAESHLYVCGPKGLIDATKAKAEAAGIAADRIHFELFDAPQEQEGDSAFEVELASSGEVFTIPPGQSIIDVLEAGGVDVMYDCQRGDCGICQCDVISGTPDHRDVVLSEAERAAGNVMQICVSRAKSPRLVLDI
ncbi:PDR/VanB family oxidoreductase [Sulfitobacter delicatus]|uniref:Vanillate O-demethylase ferredoxin subunit n=1 Tax=Sulfitobacter delicatus TaxID=218672 RepID=A0A1G7T3J8_9RHOB|nr:PDR/VanB family oxidoreductase [Sulfitobacter delicatus]SDG29835.1 vanillate O-demethylase ferredoxin subunit [Sulfitobacter delicatus]